MTRLRKMMIEELDRRNFSQSTTRTYIRAVGDLHAISTARPISWDRSTSANTRLTCSLSESSLQLRRRWSVAETPYPRRARVRTTGCLGLPGRLDVPRAKIFGRCLTSTGIAPFDRLVEDVMAQEPYRSARRVFWIFDNGSSHRGPKAEQRLPSPWPSIVPVHTPVHASWLNQVEICFSILQVIPNGST